MQIEKITLSNNEKIALISNLSTMLAAGIPILEAVDSLLEDAKKNQKKVLETLRNDLMQGKQIHVSFARFPLVFDKVTINIIKASEQAGTLDITLRDLKTSLKKEMEFTDKIKSAFIYPIFIMVVFTAVLLMILIVVIPKISSVFTTLKVDLPLPTKILVFLSNTLLTYPLYVALGTLVFLLTVFFLYKKQKRLLLRIFLLFPIISSLARDIDLTRFSRSLFLLLNAGIPITSALMLTEDLVMKKDVSLAIAHARETVVAGKKLSLGFKDAKTIFPGIMIKITEAGEKSGTLDKSMQDISEYLDYQVSNKLKIATALLEPIIIVLVGGLIGGIMLAIIAPIYGLISQIGVH